MKTKFRYRIIKMTPWFLLEVLKHGTSAVKVVSNALPADTKFVRAGHDHTGWLYLVVESSEFEALEDGVEIPIHPDTVFERIE